MKKRTLKTVITLLIINLGYALQAQTTDATATTLQKDAGDGVSIRVVDNKGTIKYLQTNNGITSITSTSSGNRTVTTWQLGGTLTDSTYIDVSNRIFALDGIKLINPATTAASTDAISLTTKDSATKGTGWTVLIRDETTGETQKILATDLIAVGRVEYTIATDDETAITVTGLAAGTAIGKISVYRNGAKLRAGVDYTLSAEDTITLDTSAAAPNNWTTYVGDIIEVQWIY